MAVKISNREYSEIYTTGKTDWLLANVGEWQTLTLDCEVAIEMLPSTNEPIQIDYQRGAFILSSGKNWGEFGFDPGMNLVAKYKEETDNNDGTTTVQNVMHFLNVSNVSGSIMEVSQRLTGKFKDLPSIPADYGTTRITDVKFYVDREPEGCRVKYVHLTNDNHDTKNLASFIDNTVPEFVRPNLGDSNGAFITMEAVGTQSGMSIRQMDVKSTGKKAGTDNVYKYQIKIQFMVSSFFQDATTFETMNIPEYLSGDGSLTDNFLIEFFPEWNNPNTMIKNDLDWTKRLGNTGWFNENFNELNNDFKVDSVQYFDTNGNVVNTLDLAVATKVKIVVSGVENLGGQTECGFGFAWIPNDESDFKNKKTPFYQNLYIQSGSLDDGFPLDVNHPDTYFGAGINGASMDTNNIKFTKFNDQIIFEAIFVPNAGFTQAFDNKDASDRNFILWVSVADGTLERQFSNRVALLADHKAMAKNIPPAGEFPFIDNAFVEHPFGEDAIGEKVLEGITQDDILCRMPFRIPRDGSTKVNQMTFGVEAFNVGTGAEFALENLDIDLTGFPTSGGIQQFDVDQTRGFKLNQGNNKNWIKIKREPGLDTVDFAGYIAYFATKIRWESWLSNPNAPSDFFDANEPNKGFHHDWIHYLRTNGWSLNFFTKINAVETGVLKQYKNQWKIKLVDYDENVNVDVTHTYFRDSDNTVLNVGTDPETGRPLGVILANEPTRIEMAFDILDTGVWDVAKTYAVTTIEIDRGAGRMEQRQLSSVWDSEGDNPLTPLANETKLKMTVDGTNKILTTACLVDPELLSDAVRYRITGRVGCFDTTVDTFDPGLYEFRYESIYE